MLVTLSSIPRRVALRALLCLAAGLAFAVLGVVSSAQATVNDGDVVLGAEPGLTCSPGADTNCTSSRTGITNISGDAFDAVGFGGIGVIGDSDSSYGVFGESSSGYGVYGYSTGNYGVYGYSVQATGGHIETGSQFGAGLEVLINNASNGRGGVEASTTGSGQGVLANATSGAGVEGISTRGPGLLGVAGGASASALKATGKTTLSGPSTLAGQSTFTGTTSFARSGKLAISANSSQVTKTNIALSPASAVLATIQGNVAGVYVQGVTTVTGTSGSFTIHLNKTTTAALSVGWFVVN